MQLRDYLLQERGRQAALAKAIGAHAPDLSRWARGSRPVPVPYCQAIEDATNKKVTRQELRPKDWKQIWADLED